MIKVYEYLVENSKFELLSEKFCELNNGIELKLFNDYRMILIPENESWENSDEIYSYLVSDKFSKIMFQLFNNENGYDFKSLAHTYLPRKLRKDNIGCLAQGLSSYIPNEKFGAFYNGGIEITVEEYLEIAKNMNSNEKLFENLYYTKFNDFIVIIECVWVYIYLCLEKRMSILEILNSFNDTNTRLRAVQCKLKNEIDSNILELFKKIYDKVSH